MYKFVVGFRLSPDDPEILEWNEKSWRQDDWVEKAECKKILGWDDTEDLADFIYQENPTLEQYRSASYAFTL